MVDDAWVEAVARTLPELPDARRERFVREYGLPPYDAEVLTARKDVADYFEAAVRRHANPKAISNWVMGDVLRVIRERKLDDALVIRDWPVAPERWPRLVRLIDDGTHQRQDRQDGLRADGGERRARRTQIVAEQGLSQVTDSGAIDARDRAPCSTPTPTRSPSTAAARTSCSASSSAR